MTPEELESVWSVLHPPAMSDGIAGRRATGLPADRPVYLAVDGRNRRHLLIRVPDDTEPLTARDTRSLEISTGRYTVGSGTEALYIDLACADPSQYGTFRAVSQDLIRMIGSDSGLLRDVVVNGLARWRAFWSTRSSTMSREDALGLFGELWFMRRWLGSLNSDAVGGWQATDGSRHDFQWPAFSVEIKTTSAGSQAAPSHRITSLDQLMDPEQGNLFLFSLQVCDDALSANSLQSLVEAISEQLRDKFAAFEDFNRKLAFRGYHPAEVHLINRPLRVLGERLYRVDEHFPRLTSASFAEDAPHSAIGGIEYSLDLAGCDRWLVARSPSDDSAQFLVHERGR